MKAELVLLTLVLQFAVLPLIIPDGYIPNLSALLILYLAFYHTSILGVWLAFFLGLLFDLSAGSLLGPSAAGLVLAYIFIAVLSKRLFLDALVSSLIFGGFASGIVFTIRYLLLSQFVSLPFWIPLIQESLSSALFAPILFWIFSKLRRKNVG